MLRRVWNGSRSKCLGSTGLGSTLGTDPAGPVYMYARYTPLDQASRFPATRRNGSRSKPRSAGFGKPNRKASPHRRREGQDEEHPVVDPGSRGRRVPRRLSGPRARALVGGAGALAAEV